MFFHQLEENLVPLPDGELRHERFFDPGERAFAAVVAADEVAVPTVGGIEEHVLRLPCIRLKRDDAAQAEAVERNARLFLHLAQQTFLRALVRLEMPADTDPLIVVDVVRLLDAVHHEIFVVALEIAERREIRFLVSVHI